MNRIQRALEALLERIDTPAPIVLADVMQENIDRMQAFADAAEPRRPATRQDAQVRRNRPAPDQGRGGRNHRRQRR